MPAGTSTVYRVDGANAVAGVKIALSPECVQVPRTAGWITAGLLIGSLRLESTAHPLQVAATLSLVMAAYCLTLPDTPPLAREGRFTVESVFPKEARSLLRERSMAICHRPY